MLHLVTDKAHHQLGWSPRWDFATTVERTVGWYRQVQQGQASALACCLVRPQPGEMLQLSRHAVDKLATYGIQGASQDGDKVVTTYPTDERTVTNRRGGGRWIFPNT